MLKEGHSTRADLPTSGRDLWLLRKGLPQEQGRLDGERFCRRIEGGCSER